LPPYHGAENRPPQTQRSVRRVLLGALLILALGPAAGIWSGGQGLISRAGAQELAGTMGELRAILAVRNAQDAKRPEEVISTAGSYLQQFPQGRYGDEALLALGDAYREQGKNDEALEAYERLPREYPMSPFGEQARLNTLPLLDSLGKQEDALKAGKKLAETGKGTVQGDQAALWNARKHYEKGDYASARGALGDVRNPNALSEDAQAEYFRLMALSLIRTGQSAWSPLQDYLKRKDRPERKAEVLMEVAQVAQKAGRREEALGFYQAVVERYPVPGQLDEARFQYAEMFRTVKVESAQGMARRSGLTQAVALYSDYLGLEKPRRFAEAIKRRAFLRRELGLKNEALEDYELAVQKDPALARDPDILLGQAVLNVELGREARASELLEKMDADGEVSQDTKGSLRLEVAAIFYQRENCVKVEALLNPMPVIKQPDLRNRAFFMRGFCRYRKGDIQKAIFDLEGLVRDPAYQHLVADPLLAAYDQTGQHSRLVHTTEELLRSGQLKPTPELLQRLSRAYVRLGEPGLMLNTLKRLEAENPGLAASIEFQYQLGMGEQSQGRPDQARVHYRKAIAAHKNPGVQPPEAYILSLEAMQELLTAGKHFDSIAELHTGADQFFANWPQQKPRLEALKDKLSLARSRITLQGGDIEKTVAGLENDLKKEGWKSPEQRGRLASLLAEGYILTTRPTKALGLYDTPKKIKSSSGQEYQEALAAGLTPFLTNLPEPKPETPGRAKLIAIYQKTFDLLPADRNADRLKVGLRLDGLYKDTGQHSKRVPVIDRLLKEQTAREQKDMLTARKIRGLLDLSGALVEKGKPAQALKHLGQAREILPSGDWRLEYEVVSGFSRAHLAQKSYPEIILENEDILPRLQDARLADQLRLFLGQVYLEWGKEAALEKNHKSARIRFAYALDNLPATDRERRGVAINGLGTALRAEGRPQEAARLFEELHASLLDSTVRRQYALFLGRLYREEIKEPGTARQWLEKADNGSNDEQAAEAQFLLSDLDLEDKNQKGALDRLLALNKRGLEKNIWMVPVNYRLAVLYHRVEKMTEALQHYENVNGEKSAAAKKRHARLIKQSTQMVREIKAYQKAGGGSSGKVKVPKVGAE